MKNPIILLGLFCYVCLSSCSIMKPEPNKRFDPENIIFVCGDDKVLMIDKEISTEKNLEIIWQWKASDTKGLPAVYVPLLATIDECKSIKDGKQLLITSSSGATLLLERESKKALFYAKTPMAHSAAYLPKDRIIVALSTHAKGNSIQLYGVGKPNKVLFKDSLYSGHGVVWNAKEKRLFALGYEELRAYSLVDWDTDSPKLVLSDTWKLPGKGGHDLVAVSDELLLISTTNGVWEFHIKEEHWAPFKPLAMVKGVKSVNWNPEKKELMYTKAEQSWWTHHVYLKNKKLRVPQIKLYKVRPLK